MSARATLAAYGERINAQDFDLLLDLIAPDATFWFTSGSQEGIAAIRTAFETTWQVMGPDEHYWLTDIEWVAEGDRAACCIYQYNWSAKGDSGSGRGTTVLAQTSAGWRIVHEHLSRKP